MTVRSMTGFARAQGSALDGRLRWSWEVRSVNGRGLDVRFRLPSGLEHLEAAVRKRAADRLARGNVNAGLTVTAADDGAALAINEPLLDRLIELAVSRAAALPEGIAPARLDGLLAVKGVLEPVDPIAVNETEEAARDAALLAGLGQAVDDLVAAREDEGARLFDILSTQLSDMEALHGEASSHAATQPDALRARLKAQVEDLLAGTTALPEDRLVQEAAVLATKADVREELDRLSAHIAQARDLLAGSEPCGRRLEFLSQEFNREANTLCSKSYDAGLTKIGLALKALIDQFREQIQNVE